MRSETLFDEDGHRWLAFGRDPNKRDSVIDTNEYVILSDGKALILDPGGIEVFPEVLSAMTRHFDTHQIEALFASHQDPDIISSLPMWLDLCPGVKAYASWLWRSFLAHFAMGRDADILPVPDEGMTLTIGPKKRRVELIPAHYCHSSGNFSVWDPTAKILFSGDIGAALLPDHEYNFYVEDFTKHVEYMRGFHLRWMPSRPALQSWVKKARALQPKMICPQHGAIFRGEDVGRFLDWLDSLEVGEIHW